MYRGTTPTLSIKVNSNLDLEDMKEIWVTIKNINKELTLDKGRITIQTTEDETRLIVQLTQKETLDFINGKANLQVRFLTESELAYASNIKEISINAILRDGEIT